MIYIIGAVPRKHSGEQLTVSEARAVFDGNAAVGLWVADVGQYAGTEVRQTQREVLLPGGRLAAALVKRLGVVAA